LTGAKMVPPRKPRTHPNEDDLKARALVAYRRFARPGESIAKLDATRADVVEIRGWWYVTLTVGKKRVAVFRLRTDDKLRRMVRPPRELRDE
jgi:hypothetical protein